MGTKLIGKKWPKLADALAANIGAQQLGLSVHNFTREKGRPDVDANDEYNDVLSRNRQKESMTSMVR
jgi:hypothetical protein